MPRRVTVLGAPGPETNALVNFLGQRFEVALLVDPPTKKRTTWRQKSRRQGSMHTLGQAAWFAWDRSITRPSSRARIKEIQEAADLDDTRPRVPTGPCDVRRADALRQIQATRPDVVVLSGCRIVPAALVQRLDVPIVNIHAGATPAYRGVHGGFWALAAGDQPGVTLHHVDAGIDTGKIIAQLHIEATPRDTLRSIPWLQLAAMLPTLEAFVLDPSRRFPMHALDGPSRAWSHPTLWQFVKANRSIRKRFQGRPNTELDH